MYWHRVSFGRDISLSEPQQYTTVNVSQVGWKFCVLATSKVITRMWFSLVTVHTPGGFIVLHHWEIRPLASWPNIPLIHIILAESCSILLMPSARLGSDKYQFDMPLVWLDQAGTKYPVKCLTVSTELAVSNNILRFLWQCCGSLPENLISSGIVRSIKWVRWRDKGRVVFQSMVKPRAFVNRCYLNYGCFIGFAISGKCHLPPCTSDNWELRLVTMVTVPSIFYVEWRN